MNKKIAELCQLVEEQACDEGLWFEGVTAPESYLQAALRELHTLCEQLWEDEDE